ncbi:hypothetical protein EYF80_052865 [Liparis tanakae]|uniref:Uncharacterized protein n=1 Tax=Liparis tanakae TaxID=230148 RepID=A0A4Z2F830_9TELE|nr:hypothetical protein EYF80_052865 [Liparis tanakae]
MQNDEFSGTKPPNRRPGPGPAPGPAPGPGPGSVDQGLPVHVEQDHVALGVVAHHRPRRHHVHELTEHALVDVELSVPQQPDHAADQLQERVGLVQDVLLGQTPVGASSSGGEASRPPSRV